MNVHRGILHISQKWKQSKYSSDDEWVNKMWYVYTMEYYAAIKEMLCWSTLQHDKTCKHYAKWGKSVTKSCTYMILFRWNFQNMQTIQTENRLVLVSCCRWGKGEWLLKGLGFLSGVMSCSKIHCGEYTILWTWFKKSLNCILVIL